MDVKKFDLSPEEKFNRMILSRVKGIGPATFIKILEEYSSASAYLDTHKSIITNNLIESIKDISQMDYLVFGEDKYPNLLSQITDPPIIIFYKGNVELMNNPRTISIVGTRLFSEYGYNVVKELVRKLISHNYVTVSGLAKGIDKFVHDNTLEQNGKTIAVLGTSIDDPSPLSNLKLYHQIIEQDGLIVSETFPNEEIGPWNFPRRNRIIAGLATKVVVIEAPIRSGALITANLAFDYNREVWAVPGNIFNSKSTGCNNLISNNKARDNSKNVLLKTLEIHTRKVYT